MPYQMNPAQFENVISLPPDKRYLHFLTRVADWEEVWTLKGPDGFVLMGDDNNTQCVPLWPHPDYAAALATGSWEGYTPERIELENFIAGWIPGMTRDNRMAAVFPTPEKGGIVVPPARLHEDLQAHLEMNE